MVLLWRFEDTDPVRAYDKISRYVDPIATVVVVGLGLYYIY